MRHVLKSSFTKNIIFRDDNNAIYSKEYLSGLIFKEYEYEYDSFYQTIIKANLNEKNITLSKYRENYPVNGGMNIAQIYQLLSLMF